MTEQTKTNYYIHYQGLINHTAFKYFRRTGFEFEELVAEGNYTLCACMKNFDPERNISFSTYLVSSLYNNLSNYIKKNNMISFESADEGFHEGWAVMDTHEFNMEMMEEISGISKLASDVLDYVFTCKVERKERQQKVISKDTIFKQFLKRGYGQTEILKTFDKILISLESQIV